jgi:hypothetical protein
MQVTPQTLPTNTQGSSTQAIPSHIARAAGIGKIAQFLLGNQTVMDPKTGEESTVPNKPGDLFRHILAGAILGGVSGAGTENGFKGANAGSAAVRQNDQQQQERMDQRSQQIQENNYKNQQLDLQKRQATREDQAESQRQQEFKATTEHWNVENIRADADFNIRSQDHVDAVNQQNQEMSKWIAEAGGVMAPVKNNDTMGNGKDLSSAYVGDPGSLNAPANNARMLITHVDTTGLTNDPTKGWIDEKGNHVNLEDRTTHTLYYVPQTSAKTPIQLTGSQLMKNFPDVYGNTLDKDHNYTVSFNDLTSLGQKQAESRRTFDTEVMKEKSDALRTAYEQATLESTNARDQIKDLTTSGVESTDPRVVELQGKLKNSEDDMRTITQQMNPYLRPKGSPAPAGSPTGTQPTVPGAPEKDPDFGDLPEAGSTKKPSGVGKFIKNVLDKSDAVTSETNEPGSAIPTGVAEIPASVARRNAKVRGMAPQAYKDELAKHGISIVKDSAVASIPPGAITATNPQSKEKSFSTDGGKTWTVVGAK